MLTKPNAGVTDKRPFRTRAKPPKLTLDEKRQAVLEWFASDATIREFRAGGKDVPHPFIRKAADALGLRALRKKRTEEGVCEIVEAKIMTFRPGAVDDERKKPKTADTKPDAANAKGPKLSMDQKRQFVLEWFASDTSIRDYRRDDKTVPRLFIRKASRALDLEDLRKKRDEEGISETVADKINNFPPRKQLKGREQGKVKAAPGVDRPKLSLDEKREFVLGWFASDESIRDFRAGEKNVPRPFIRKAANALGLRELRKKREQDGVHEIAAEKIMSFRPKKGGDAPAADEGAMLPVFNPEWMKTFLLEWFDDAKMRGIPRLLRDRGAADAQRTVMRLVKASSLRKLRKAREKPGVRDAAIAAISKGVETAAMLTVFSCQKGLQKMELDPEKVLRSRDLHRAEISQGSDGNTKGLLLKWFNSEDMHSVGKVLRENDALDMKDTMTGLISKNGLRKLRKDREKPEARKKAMKKIEKLLLSPSAPAGSNGRSELAGSAKKEKLRGLLLEFFFDDEMLSVHDFLESRGEADLQKDMGRCVRKLRLNKLKKERVKLRQKVTLGIEDLFRKKAKFAAAGEVGGGKGEEMQAKEGVGFVVID